MPETNDSTQPVSSEITTREKFEQERLSRRAALRKIGMTTGMALFGMFAVDDLARVAIKRMEEHQATRELGETVAKEFKNSGIVFAASGSSSSGDPCTDCIENCVADDNYDCIPCDGCTAPASSKSAVAEDGFLSWFRKAPKAKQPASCIQSPGQNVVNCDACMTDCASLCRQRNNIFAWSKCNAKNTCSANCDDTSGDGNRVWDCWKSAM